MQLSLKISIQSHSCICSEKLDPLQSADVWKKLKLKIISFSKICQYFILKDKVCALWVISSKLFQTQCHFFKKFVSCPDFKPRIVVLLIESASLTWYLDTRSYFFDKIKNKNIDIPTLEICDWSLLYCWTLRTKKKMPKERQRPGPIVLTLRQTSY